MKSHKLILLATAAALAALALPASAAGYVDSDPVWNSVKGKPAPVIQVIRPADSTGTYRPATVSVFPVSAAQIVPIVTDEIAKRNIPSGGGGSTALGTIYSTGSWTNTGKFPLMVTTGTVDGACYGYDVFWSGGQAQLADNCEWSQATVSYIVPPNTTFKITGGPNSTTLRTSVTALADNVTWAMTGVNGYMGQTEAVAVSTTYSLDACGGTQQTTTYRSYANYTISGPTGSPTTTTSTSGPACGGGGSGADGG